MSTVNEIKAKALAFIDMINLFDRGVTNTPVGMFNFDERPVFHNNGGAITYTTEKHTYWGAGVGCLATVVKELSTVLDTTLNLPSNTLTLRKDPYIECLIMKSTSFSGQYERIREEFNLVLGDFSIDDSSKTDFFNFPCLIEKFDFKSQEDNKIGSLANAIKAMQVINSYELFLATLGEGGKAYQYLDELEANEMENVVLMILNTALTKLVEKSGTFMERIEAHRLAN